MRRQFNEFSLVIVVNPTLQDQLHRLSANGLRKQGDDLLESVSPSQGPLVNEPDCRLRSAGPMKLPEYDAKIRAYAEVMLETFAGQLQ